MPYWRLSSFYFTYFALLGAIVPFWAMYLSDQGYSPIEIGVLSAILMGTKVISPYILGWLADKTGKPMRVIRYSALLAFICFLAIFFVSGFYWLIIIVASFTFFWNAVIGQFESVTLAYLGEGYTRYGSVRAWGSIGFIVAVIALGWVFDRVAIEYLPVFMAVMLLSIWRSSLWVKEREVSLIHEESRGLASIFKRPSVRAFFIVCFLLQFSHGAYYTFYSLYLIDYGYSKPLIGLFWGGAVIAELVLFLAMSRVLQWFSVRGILMFSLACCAVRWSLIGLYPENITLLIFAQILHAGSFASFHAVAVTWIRHSFGNSHQGQGQALYSAVSFGAGGSVGAIFSGSLWDYNPTLVWLISALAGLIACLIIWRFVKEPSY